MIESFGIPPSSVAKYAGFCGSIFSLVQAIMGIPLGRGSDRYGRKPAILLGLTITLSCTLLFGFSRGITQALIARGLMGAGAGNVGIIRTTVAEMVPFKELQPRAFSAMPLVWNVGSVFGPILGGALANPLGLKPEEMGGKGGLLVKYPYALPNIVSAAFFAIGAVTGFLFLHETLESKGNDRDYGLILGKKITGGINDHVVKVGQILHVRPNKIKRQNNENDPLLKPAHSDEENDPDTPAKSKAPPPSSPSYREVLNRQSVINLIVYTLLAAHTLVCDQILAVFMHYPRPNSLSNPQHDVNAHSTNPLKFSGGLGLSSSQIGYLSTLYGVISMLAQLLLFPPVVRRYSSLAVLKVCAVGFPMTYVLVPFTALLPTQEAAKWACFLVYVLKGFCAIFSFPCSTILLTNSASSLRVLGTLNGIAVSSSAVGRAVGPAVTGAVFTWGVERGWILVPWALLAGIAVVAAVPVWWLVEGEGFAGDDEASDEREQEAESDDAAASTPQPRRNGAAGSEVAIDDAITGDPGIHPSTPDPSTSTRSPAVGSPPSSIQSGHSRFRRRSSVPIGTGTQGLGRRFSTNLGASLGTAGSWNG